MRLSAPLYLFDQKDSSLKVVPLTSVAFSPDSKYIACGSTDTKIRLWDTTGSPIGQPFGEDFRPIKSLALSPDGKHIVSGAYRTVRLWDTTGNRTGGLFQRA
jgi:WD40 repeat protein